MSGWYAMKRGWQGHPVFDGQAYSDRDAWVWMIENAAHSETFVNVRGNPVSIQRGQLSYSIRFLATAWGWHRNRVARFLERLKKWELIETAGGTAQVVITVCNYSVYQDVRDSAGTPSGTEAGRGRDRGGTNNNNDNNDKQKGNITSKPPKTSFQRPDWIPEIAWKAYIDHRKAMKIGVTDHALGLATKQLEKLRQEGHDPTEVINQSILRGWKGLFAVKGDDSHGSKPHRAPSAHENMLAGFGFADFGEP